MPGASINLVVPRIRPWWCVRQPCWCGPDGSTVSRRRVGGTRHLALVRVRVRVSFRVGVRVRVRVRV